MSLSQYERGNFIRLKIHGYILDALGHGEINADGAGDVYDLISFVETSGSTHNSELAEHPFYKKAVEAWREVRERRIKKYEQKINQ